MSLIEDLGARGVIATDAPPPPVDAAHRPWFIALMLGLAGWLAGILLLVFVDISFELKSTSAMLILGLVLSGAAWTLYFADRNAVFLDQLALALSVAGQCAIGWALLDDVRSGLTIFATLLVLQLVVLLVMPNKTARTLAALFASIAWVYTIRFVVRPGVFYDLFDNMNLRHGQPEAWHVLLTWLITWVPLLLAARWLMLRENVWMAHRLRVYARPVLTGVLLALSLGGVATEPFVTLAFGSEAIGVQMNWIAVFPLLSVALAMFSAWCAFQLRSNGLLGFAIFAALMHLARFYYFYGTSLMWKSVIMLCLGVVMLGVGMLIQQRLASVGSAK